MNHISLALIGSIFFGEEIGQAFERHVSVKGDRVRIETISLWVEGRRAVLQSDPGVLHTPYFSGVIDLLPLHVRTVFSFSSVDDLEVVVEIEDEVLL